MFEVCVKGKDEHSKNETEQQDFCQAGVMLQDGDLYFNAMKFGNTVVEFDSNGQAFAEIKDGLELDLAKGIANELLMSNEDIYKGLRDKFVITISIIPEEVLRVSNAVRVHFEDKEKYLKRLKAKWGINE